jgi:hypothetical protein
VATIPSRRCSLEDFASVSEVSPDRAAYSELRTQGSYEDQLGHETGRAVHSGGFYGGQLGHKSRLFPTALVA